MGCCDVVHAPKTFLTRWPLKFGAKIVSVVYAIVYLICTIISGVYSGTLYKDMFTKESLRNKVINFSYGGIIVSVIFCIFMFALSLAVLWGIYKKRALLLFGWLVLTAVWLTQTFILFLVLVFLYSYDVNFIAWILSLVFGIVAFLLLVYGLLVIYGFVNELNLEKAST